MFLRYGLNDVIQYQPAIRQFPIILQFIINIKIFTGYHRIKISGLPYDPKAVNIFAQWVDSDQGCQLPKLPEPSFDRRWAAQESYEKSISIKSPHGILQSAAVFHSAKRLEIALTDHSGADNGAAL